MILPKSLEAYQVIVLDTEFVMVPGEPYEPVCLGWKYYGAETVHVHDRREFLAWTSLPFPVERSTLFVAYNAAAESGFLYQLPVEQPWLWLDLMAEARLWRNVCIRRPQLDVFHVKHPEVYRPNVTISLVEACRLYGVDVDEGVEDVKEASRDLILSRAWAGDDPEVWRHIRDYCASDVLLTEQLLAKVEGRLQVRPAVIRGSYSAEQGRMTQRGIPADGETYQQLLAGYQSMLQRYRVGVEAHGIALAPKGKPRLQWLEGYLQQRGLATVYPRTPKGKPSTRQQLVRQVAERHEDAVLLSLSEWLHLLTLFPAKKGGGLRCPPLGRDGRFRWSLFPFSTHTGRSLGAGSEVLMQMPAWLRGFIYPKPGEVLVYADYAGQEIAIAAGLSGDVHLREAYESDDIYLGIARMAGALREEMSVEAVRGLRRVYKSLTLGKLYGLGFDRFYRQSGVSHSQAVRAWQFFERHFARFRQWQLRQVELARRTGWIQTRLGWGARVYDMTPTTTLLNWLIQSHGADVLRTAVLLLAGGGVRLVSPIHDAVLVSMKEADVGAQLPALVSTLERAAVVVIGASIRVEVKVVHPGERLLTGETEGTWSQVMTALQGEQNAG